MFELNPHVKKKQKETGIGGVEDKFVKRVKKEGGKAYKFVSEMNRGVSDRIVIFPGQVWFVEIKTETGKMSKLQQIFKNYITGLGLNHYTIYGETGFGPFMREVKNAEGRKAKNI